MRLHFIDEGVVTGPTNDPSGANVAEFAYNDLEGSLLDAGLYTVEGTAPARRLLIQGVVCAIEQNDQPIPAAVVVPGVPDVGDEVVETSDGPRWQPDAPSGASGLVDERYLVNATQQVLLDGNSAFLTDFVEDTQPAQGTASSYTTPAVTFIGAGVRTVTLSVEVDAGTDGGIATSGGIALSSTGVFNDNGAPLVKGATAALVGVLSFRRHFADGETLTPLCVLAGADNTKHGAVFANLWIAA